MNFARNIGCENNLLARRASVCVALCAAFCISLATFTVCVEAHQAGVVKGRQSDAQQIIERERASFDAWKRGDKAFYENYWSQDFTEYILGDAHLGTKAELMPKFEELTLHWKLDSVDMRDARVQPYGNIAILTYEESVSGLFDGAPTHYSGNVTMVYAKEGTVWRALHYHESKNGTSN